MNREIAVQLLREGFCSPTEAADALGVDRRLVDYWIKAAAIDWRQLRADRIKRRVDRLKSTRGN